MPFAACLSVAAATDLAVDEVCSRILQSLGQQAPDLTVIFVSHHHRESFSTLAAQIQSRLRTRFVIGCAGEFIAGGDREIEDGPALSVWSAVLPGADSIDAQISANVQHPGKKPALAGVVAGKGVPDFDQCFL